MPTWFWYMLGCCLAGFLLGYIIAWIWDEDK
jgi:hypothetical protein